MLGGGTYRAGLHARGEEPSESNLGTYLAALSNEDWGAEFKTAAQDGDFQLRKAVASMGNHEGGELFVGVDDNRRIVGTALDLDQFYQRLRQAGTPQDWFLLDLGLLVVATKPVPITIPGKRVLVAEVRKAVLPGLVLDQSGKLVWFERRGRSDHTLEPVEWVEVQRRYARARLLLELYREFEGAVRGIPDYPIDSAARSAAGRYFILPRFESSRSDGSFYSVLTEEDRALLLVQRGNAGGPGAPGLLQRFLDTGGRIDHQASFHPDASSRYQNVAQELRQARSTHEREVVLMAQHLQALGVIPQV